jgi:stage V sporulation protein R
MTQDWRTHIPRLEDLARKLGLEWSPVIFEAVPDSFMTEIAVYGLPVRMPHWSFGARYIYQLVQRHMGYSRLFEVVFPGNPGHAYLASSNALADNILVTAHVLGHADFSKNNLLFRRCQEQGSEHIVEHAATHARQIEQDIENHGQSAVEQVLDAALSLEQYVDLDQPLRRERYPEYLASPKAPADDGFRTRFAALDAGVDTAPKSVKVRAPLPSHPERDLLWFIATYAPEMESWERDIFLAVREESFYFFPVHATQIMNACCAKRISFRKRRTSMPSSATRMWCGRSRRAKRARSPSIPITWASRFGRKSSSVRGSMPRCRSGAKTMTSASCATT